MADVLDSCEVDYCIANDLCGILGRRVWTHGIGCSNKHRDRHLFDACDVNLRHLLLTLLPVGCKFLEAVGVVGVLPPMKLILYTNWLVGTLNHLACFLTQLIANLLFIFVPTGTITVEAINANSLDVVQVVQPVALWTILR